MSFLIKQKAFMLIIKAEPVHFSKQIAFNVIPHIDIFLEDGSTKEEWKMITEVKKILDPQNQAFSHLRKGTRVCRAQ